MMIITDEDLAGCHIEFTQELKKVPVEIAAEKKGQTRYILTFKVKNCPARNAAIEALTVFQRIGQCHMESIQSEFKGGFLKKLGNIFNSISEILPSIPESVDLAVQKVSLFRAGF
jgi:hypothetical protein